MTSPARRPAAAPGVPSSTCSTRMPDSVPKYSASCPPTESARMSSRARPGRRVAKPRTTSGNPRSTARLSDSANSLARSSISARRFSNSSTSTRMRSANPRGTRAAQPELSAGVTLSATGDPSRSTRTGAARPAGVSSTSRANWRAPRTRSPSNSTMTSPASMPAASAGPSARTSVTTAPSAPSAASSTSRTETPISGRDPPISNRLTTVRSVSSRSSCVVASAPAANAGAASAASTVMPQSARLMQVVVAMSMIPPWTAGRDACSPIGHALPCRVRTPPAIGWPEATCGARGTQGR